MDLTLREVAELVWSTLSGWGLDMAMLPAAVLLIQLLKRKVHRDAWILVLIGAGITLEAVGLSVRMEWTAEHGVAWMVGTFVRGAALYAGGIEVLYQLWKGVMVAWKKATGKGKA